MNESNLQSDTKFINCISFKFAWDYCRLLFKNFCILCSVLTLLGFLSQALTLQGKFEFHKCLNVTMCCLDIPGERGEAHPHLVPSLAQPFAIKLKLHSCLHSFRECFSWQMKSRIYD